ncbi:MAG: AI-2E family transporter [Planctomycetes bacterium]|nr:AI-2E family transporter [Planctomycetota bacterium]
MAKKLVELWPLDRRGTHAFMAASAIISFFIFVIALEFVFTPFFIALTLAFILNPFVSFGERLAVPRWASTFLIFILLTMMMIFFITAIVPSFIQEFNELSSNNDLFQGTPEELIARMREFAKTYVSPDVLVRVEEIIRSWFAALQSSGPVMRDTTFAMGGRVFAEISKITSLAMMALLVPFYMFFLLVSYNKINTFVQTYLIPYEYKEVILHILGKINQSLSAFFRGRLLVCLLIGTFAWLGLLYLDVPFPFIFGFAIGFATIVPLMGLLFLLPAIGFYWMAGADMEQMIYLIAYYSLLQGLEMFLLTPFILGKEVELPPMILVMSILSCGYLFGAIGVVMAVPIASTCKILFNEFIFPSFVELSKKNTNSPRVIQKKKNTQNAKK